MDKTEQYKIINRAKKNNRTELNLSDKEITELVPEIGELTRLEMLYLDNNQLTALPPEFSQLVNLRRLYLSNNQLTVFPPEVSQLANLQSLSLKNNQLTVFPPEISQLTNLQRLYLSNNQLTVLPPEISQLTNLQILSLENNQLTVLPHEITKLVNLQYLSLSNNQLTELPQEISLLANVQRLYLSNNQLTELPQEISLLANLQRLSISNNQLTALPQDISRLVNLRSLYIDDNQLTALPIEISQLVNLWSLSLANNQLTALPIEVSQLTNLKVFVLTNNQLTTLPTEISQLANLQKLYLANNQLTTLPSDVSQLTNLEVLFLANNQLTTLPTEISQLVNLQELYLANNQLTALPQDLKSLKNLRMLSVFNNPYLEFPPQSIVSQGNDAILAFIREKKMPQWVSKMLLVGEGGVGKTSLFKALKGEPFDENEDQTHGIQIGKLELDHPKKPGITMTLNCWDFGGQEIYHATHQFYLTKRSLFVLVWNARYGYEQGKLNYWLDTIKSKAPDAPVIIVATQIDEHPAAVPIEEYRRKYPKIEGFYEVSNKTGENIDDLHREIRNLAAGLRLMGEPWPVSWLGATKAILSIKDNNITPEDMRKVMQVHGLDEEKQDILTRCLHDLGHILYYPDDPELQDIIILKPQWVSQHISRILDSDEVKEKEGILTRSHMNKLWADLPPGMRHHFLRLMEKFDLSYRTLDYVERSLIVERLSMNPPKGWDEQWKTMIPDDVACKEITIKYKLNRILPGIPTWFIARAHRFTTHKHWRFGAVFVDSEGRHLGLVRALTEDHIVILTVRGPNPSNFFSVLRDTFEYTLERYPGLNPEKKIPCPEGDVEEFLIRHLEKAMETNEPTLTCRESGKNISVARLLFGVSPESTTQQILDELRDQRKENEKHFETTERLNFHQLELISYLQRMEMKSIRLEQEKINSICPSLFALRPRDGNKTWQKISGRKMDMQLYCEAPGCWHPLGEPYTIDKPAYWLVGLAPHVKRIVGVLKWIAPLAGPILGSTFKDYEEMLKNDVELMIALVDKLPEIRVDEQDTSKFRLNYPEFDGDKMPNIEDIDGFLEGINHLKIDEWAYGKVEGTRMRMLYSLLNQLDPAQQWCGLEKVITPEGFILWLCPHHAAEYRV